MRRKITVRVSKIVVEETDYIIQYPTEELFDQVVLHLSKEPETLRADIPREHGGGATCRQVDHRELSETTCLTGSLGPEPTVYIYDSDTAKIYFDNGQQELEFHD